ncbi:MAG TPA: protein-L-isoaspartate(D-aspartate) O-methyltransferase [Vicinamibacterales bacterium]|nr:protein-L-isoaspartate(D-aspartate) O-methyltransferase [Vicinamibacterales bacterium]
MIIDTLRAATLSGLTLCLVMACAADGVNGQDFEAMRSRMVDTQIRARDVQDAAVLQAMRRVPRHLFVPDDMRPYAYDDRPLPIGRGQTISQPYIVGYMTQALQLQPSHKVLEIGTGSGYQAAVLAELVKQVYSIEIVPDLAEGARRALAQAGYKNVEVRSGNGYLGWPERAPFDRIIVTAAPPEIPQALIEQLAVGGVMVVPVGTAYQELVIITKTPGGVTQKRTIEVRFVPMVSKPSSNRD